MAALGLQLLIAAAAGLADHLRPLGDNVGGEVGGKFPDVGGGLLIDAQQLHVRHRLGKDLNGADALLRGHSGVGAAANDGGVELVLPWGGGDDLPRVPAAVQDGGLLGGNPAVLHVLGAPQADFLADGEHGLHGGVGQIVFHNGAQGLHNGRHARLVVPAQHGVPLAADDSVLNHGLHPDAGDHRVHVGGQENGLAGDGPGQGAVHVACLAAGQLHGLVHIDLTADGLQILRDAGGHGPLVGALAVDADVVQEGAEQAFFVNHGKDLLCL